MASCVIIVSVCLIKASRSRYHRPVRSYRQFCGLAKALDAVGDRWTLLIVRELLIRGSARYSELQHGLPGVPTNLLAGRLRQLERAGLVERGQSPPAFRLTPRGLALDDVIAALGRWASPLMGEPDRRDAIRGHWLVLPMRLYLRDRTPKAPPATIQIELPDQPIVLRTTRDGRVTSTPGRAAASDATVTGSPLPVMGLLQGRLTLRQARARGVRLIGSAGVLRRLAPAG
jgi:DNA-binding HxlR family transcriptional regulator